MTAHGKLPVISNPPVVTEKPADILWQGTIHETFLSDLLQKVEITVLNDCTFIDEKSFGFGFQHVSIQTSVLLLIC